MTQEIIYREHNIALRFEIESEILKCIQQYLNKKKKTSHIYGSISIDFKDSGEKFITKDGKEKTFYKISNCYDGVITEKEFAVIHYIYNSYNQRVNYNIPTKFYLNENDIRKNLPYDKTAVKVRIIKDNSLGIMDIEEIQ